MLRLFQKGVFRLKASCVYSSSSCSFLKKKPMLPARCNARGFSASAANGEKGPKKTLDYLGLLVSAGVMAYTGYLGYWQYYRSAEKQQAIEERTRGLQGNPTVMTKILREDEIDEKYYQKMQVTGEFIPSKQVYIGPRPIPEKLSTEIKEKTGYVVLVPFKLENNGGTILVKRGWIPKSMRNDDYIPKGKITIDVVPVPFENPSTFVPDNLLEKGEWYSIIPSDLSKYTGVATPITLVDALDDDENRYENEPIGWRPHDYVNFRIDPTGHLIYAGTWWSLSVAMGVIAFIKFLR